MWTGFAAEFVGTVIFAVVVLLVLTSVSSKHLFAISIFVGLGLALGIWVCLLLGGPGYLNPAVAVLVGVKDQKSAAFTGGMVLAEFLAVLVVLAAYFGSPNFALCGSHKSSSSSSDSS